MEKINWDKILKIGEYWGKKLLLVIVSGIVLWLLVCIFVGNPKNLSNTKNEVKFIQTKIDSISENIKFLTDRQYQIEQNQIRFQESIDENNRNISQYNKDLINLKKVYNDKIRSVDTYNINDLDSFFRSRYQKFYKE